MWATGASGRRCATGSEFRHFMPAWAGTQPRKLRRAHALQRSRRRAFDFGQKSMLNGTPMEHENRTPGPQLTWEVFADI